MPTTEISQRKIAIFVTRDGPSGSELLVFWHPGSGIQIPAGTVEEGESFLDAAAREAREETGLDDLELVQELGVRTFTPGPGHAFVLRGTALRTRPDGPVTPWRLGRTMVDVVDRQDRWTRVVYAEPDHDAPDGQGITVARLEGWVPGDVLAPDQVRAFFHFRADKPTPERWHQQAEPEHVFELSWHRLDPPPVLVGAQSDWLAEFRGRLS